MSLVMSSSSDTASSSSTMNEYYPQTSPAPTGHRPDVDTVPIIIAIYKEPLRIKHWEFLIDDVDQSSKIVYHILYHREDNRKFIGVERKDPRESDRLLELFHLCNVPRSEIPELREVARRVCVWDRPFWSSQTYVMDLLEDLELRRILNRFDPAYSARKEELDEKRDFMF